MASLSEPAIATLLFPLGVKDEWDNGDKAALLGLSPKVLRVGAVGDLNLIPKLNNGHGDFLF